ncbi:serine protease [Phyllobacterium brassicacearum]|uniref:Probable periplasmic serine endoprotease DegP-like n=1 Tax=Phyllobacterium brassicacearum TaxID=314235 RepID=A0A2P7BU16_9HYPH|nr:DegQ family serine endoprotease [Phyllobacterium brassicacearum]PSH69892.1 serine protease [Phyllobacterium brassicacearum]TDQ35064.1 serine protease Do [Phyllobacterium brassicacearum]
MVFKTGRPVLRSATAAIALIAFAATSATPAFVTVARAQTQPVPVPNSEQPRAQGPASVADLADGLIDAVVNISTSQTVKGQDGDSGPIPMPKVPEGSPFQEFFDEYFGKQNPGQNNPSHKVQSLGSGFVVDAQQGIIVTNNHVIADADEIEVNFNDGSKLKAELVGKDTKTDIAVLKVDPKKHKLVAVKFGDSSKTRIGDWVMAIGNPFGFGGTVTVGIVSARNRDINSGPYDNFIQTDAAINRGNSGGPLFDMYGQVIGINTAIISPTGGSIGIGFAIPAELASGVIAQLREFGETRRGWLGVRIQPVTDEIAESLGMPSSKGALVAGIIDGGPVANGSILAGDVIIRFDGKPVNNVKDLPRVVAESPVGKEVDVVIVRKGKEETVKVTLGRLEDSEQQAKKDDQTGQGEDGAVQNVDVLGMTLDTLNDDTRKSFGISKEVQGVLITEVQNDSVAANKRIQAGDVIVDIAQEAVSSPDDVAARIEKLRDEGRKNALLMLASKTGELRFVTLQMD